MHGSCDDGIAGVELFQLCSIDTDPSDFAESSACRSDDLSLHADLPLPQNLVYDDLQSKDITKRTIKNLFIMTNTMRSTFKQYGHFLVVDAT